MQNGGTNIQHDQNQPIIDRKKRSWLYLAIVVVAAIIAGGLIWWGADQAIKQNIQAVDANQPVLPTKSTATPQLTTEVVVSGRDHIWDVGFLPSGEVLFTERKGTVSLIKDGQVREMLKLSDIHAAGEGGLMGLTVDPKFTDNRFVYICFNSTQGNKTIRVSRLQLNVGLTKLENRSDIITDIPSNNSLASAGRHSGCRMGFGPDDHLWIGTGDTAQGDTSVQPKNLGGKILRIDREGRGVAGNLGDPFDSRIYSYGHRNTQGLTFFPNPKTQQDVVGVSVEHGSSVDDEVNLLKPGNFGWAPGPTGYNEGVPMTDKQRFPDAVDAIWSSGDPTQAPSGATFLKGSQWKAWEGALAVAFLKDKKITIMHIDKTNKLAKEEQVLKGQFGRLRAASLSPGGDLFVSTDNGNNDQIIRIIAH